MRPALAQAVPLLLRVHTGALLRDSEVAITNRTPEGDADRLHLGYRLTQGAGYELLPGVGGEPDAHGVRGGTRFGLDWDP